MAMTLRATKGSILSWAEGDANWQACVGKHNLLHIQEVRTGNGGSFDSGAWRTRTFNTTKINNISGASFASNQVTIPAGDYYVLGRGVAFSVGYNVMRVQQITPSALELAIGMSVYLNTVTTDVGINFVDGLFSITVTSSIELQHRCSNSSSNIGFGNVDSFSPGVLAELKVWKL